MTLKFWGGLEAEEEFRDDFMTVHRNSGYTGCYSKGETEAKWADLKQFSKASETAMKIFTVLEGAKDTVHIVGMSGGFQCFGSSQGKDNAKGVIFVDLDAKVNITAKTAHNLHLSINEMARLWSGKSDGVTVTELDNRITLLHEMGHAKQWTERKGWFDHDYRTATKFGEGDKAPTMQQVSGFEILQKAKRLHLKRVIYSYPAGTPADLSFLPEKEFLDEARKKPVQKLAAPVVWGVPIEHDNMRRHEWPICRELGLPLRRNYGDMSPGNSFKNRNLDSHMNAWIREEEKAKQAANTSRLAEIPKGQKQCDHTGCTFVGSNIKVTQHKLAVHR